MQEESEESSGHSHVEVTTDLNSRVIGCDLVLKYKHRGSDHEEAERNEEDDDSGTESVSGVTEPFLQQESVSVVKFDFKEPFNNKSDNVSIEAKILRNIKL